VISSKRLFGGRGFSESGPKAPSSTRLLGYRLPAASACRMKVVGVLEEMKNSGVGQSHAASHPDTHQGVVVRQVLLVESLLNPPLSIAAILAASACEETARRRPFCRRSSLRAVLPSLQKPCPRRLEQGRRRAPPLPATPAVSAHELAAVVGHELLAGRHSSAAWSTKELLLSALHQGTALRSACRARRGRLSSRRQDVRESLVAPTWAHRRHPSLGGPRGGRRSSGHLLRLT